MCFILFAHRVHPRYPLVFAANRDEFHERPTAGAGFWEDAPEVLGGRDLRAGGTWLGITRAGRWAALTNVREAGGAAGGGPSRGALVADYLRSGAGAAEWVRDVAARMEGYAGFNLLVGEADEVWYVGNRGGEPRALEPGVYGLSNHLLDTPWPKVVVGKAALAAELDPGRDPDPEALFGVLASTDPAPDDGLPDTGVGRELERALSSLFIATPHYGTRASTVLLVDGAGEVTFVERSFLAGPRVAGEARFHFRMSAGAFS